MYMKNDTPIAVLLKKIKAQYELLEKIPLTPKFYEAYSEYRNLADAIEDICKIDSAAKTDLVYEVGRFDSFFGYITYKVIPLIFFMQENKKILFKKLPENEDKWFLNLEIHFAKLAKLQGDTRMWAWFAKTEKVLNDFLDQIETTEKGNKLFLGTNIMNVMHEILRLDKAHAARDELRTTPLQAIHGHDVHSLVLQLKKMDADKEVKPSPSLRSHGEIGIMSAYSNEGMTKETMMMPVHIFQSKLPDAAEVQSEVLTELDFDEAQSILCFAGKKIQIAQRSQSDPHDLLVTIFKDKSKVWNTDEVLEDWRLGDDLVSPQKVYQAGKAVNRIVAQKTTIEDFLIATLKKVYINKAYLKK